MSRATSIHSTSNHLNAISAEVSGYPTTHPSAAAELTNLKIRLRGALRQFPDFPSEGILFEDILPIFANASLHEALIRCLELLIIETYGDAQKPDVVVGLEARGFLFGPSLALKLGAAFVPVRKKGKLPGPVETVTYQKEYGQDSFQMQADAIKAGQKVLVVDDIIATGVYPFFILAIIFMFLVCYTGVNSYTSTQVDPQAQLELLFKNSEAHYSVSFSFLNSISSKGVKIFLLRHTLFSQHNNRFHYYRIKSFTPFSHFK